jgi:hypothetical protein
MHGCGKLVMASGATYTGMFNAGLMDGECELSLVGTINASV